MEEHRIDPEATDAEERGHKWFAVFFDWMVKTEGKAHRQVRAEVAGGAEGRVLEVGCGNGANFPYYTRAATHIVAVDPDPYMLSRARTRAAEMPRPIEIHKAPAERLPFEDADFDTVVATLVLCSVRRQAKALAEIKRVLRPGGQLRFYEHVRYSNAFGAFWQDAITPVWRWMGAGCHPNRDTEKAIRKAGFEILELRRPVLEPPVPPMIFTRPMIVGVAVLR